MRAGGSDRRPEPRLTADVLLRAMNDRAGVRVAAAGAWTAANAGEIDRLIDGVLPGFTTPRKVAIDMGAVAELDTFGARLLERLTGEAKARGCAVEVTGLAERYRGLTEAVGRAGEPRQPEGARGSWLEQAQALAEKSAQALVQNLLAFLDMLGAVAFSIVRIAQRPRTFRLTSAVHHLDRVGWQAVPIILLITFLIGCIIAQQGFFHFRKFGADEYVVDMVGILVLREIGVLIVAIMVAGRSGSSYTAELGSMRMREEIDALRTMGFDPVEVLVLPRVAALVVALPVLAFLGAMSALFGGGLVAWIYGGMDPSIFIVRLKEAISITHFEVGMIKAPFMALVIGIVACAEGFQVQGSAESLGLRTTQSVVKAIFLVIVLDGFFAMFFASIGM